ncbi:dehydrogenase [Betaproteobacteria bacterium GR16-43]|nr:dehydrogenase [Betaproteobacteria bacterium GR16-43]
MSARGKARRVLVVQGHPDPRPERFCRALAKAYAEGARAGGHEVRELDVAALEFPVLRRRDDWATEAPTPDIRSAQLLLAWADHIVIVHPLWLGAMPALLKAFLEQAFRPGFAFAYLEGGGSTMLLKGRSARVVVTMGMPGLVYTWFYRAHSLKSFARNVLGFCGIHPVRSSVVGMVESPHPEHRERWLERMRGLGRRAD